MKRLKWCASIVLVVVLMLATQQGRAELAQDRVEFYQERTEEWEHALGDYVLWNYYERAMFCTIYGRRPGDYLNGEHVQDDIPKFPSAECITYEDALMIATSFLCDYDPRITEEYLSGMHIGSAYYDFWRDSQNTITRKAHVQVWIIQFGEENDAGEYIVRCDAYIDAVTGIVVCIDIGIDMKNADDLNNFETIYLN